MTEHTPPPWYNSGLYVFHHQPHPDVEPPGYYQHIAMLYELMPLGSTKANANLMVSAPDLLAALEIAVDSGKSWKGITDARAAIAKAKGVAA